MSKIRLRKEKFELDRPIKLPFPIKQRIHQQKHLFIAVKVPTWVVLDEEKAFIMTMLIKNHTLRETINTHSAKFKTSPETSMNKLQSLISLLYSKDFFNKSYIKSDQQVQKVRNLQFHLTNRCNLRCIHCYMDSGVKHYDEISIPQWKDIIDEASSRYEKWFLSLTGGEPLVYQGYSEILKYAKEKGATTGMISNGTLLSKRKIEELDGILDHLQISLDGATEEVNDRIRGKGVFRKVVQNLNLLRETNIRIGLNVVVMKSNANNLKENLHKLIKEELGGMNIDIDLSSFVSEGRGIDLKEDIEPTHFSSTISYTAEHFIKEDEWMPTPSYPRRNCGYGNTIDIYPNGDVSPCLTPRFIRGNLLKEGISTVFNSIDIEHNESMVDRLPECKSCDLRYICGGRCHLTSLSKGEGIQQVDCDDLYKERMFKNLIKQFEATTIS
ncbi:radical SAM protein [Alcanivoracaceae bacterium MT1]